MIWFKRISQKNTENDSCSYFVLTDDRCFHVFSFSAVVSSSRSLHIKNSTSHNALLFIVLNWKKKRQSTAVNLGENAVQSESGCFCVVCVSISIVDLFTKSFGVFVAFLMKLHVFTFWIFLLLWWFHGGGRSLLLFFWTAGRPRSWSCVHGHKQNVSAEKNSKRSKKEKKEKTWLLFVQILFISKWKKKKILTLNKVDKE